MQEPANSLRGKLSGADNEEFGEQVRRGLKAGEFHVVFQPFRHVRSDIVSGAECLLRWNHPQFGLLPAGAFSDAFSDHETACDVFRFVLGVACEKIAAWKMLARLERSPRVAINVTASILLQEDLLEEIVNTTACHKINPSCFDLEIVETEDASKLLSLKEFTKPLRDMGVRLICDDFGVAHPPLVTLSTLHVDGLKLDKMFLKNIPESDRAGSVLKSILNLCSQLQLSVVVEGVENEAQFNWLASYGDVEVQGIYVGKPQSDFVTAMLLNRN
ncbi:EAL domain-containing protein [Burkholderia ubonensis]|uniref:EAL domain-containing protein n=1 Tax=Burkholderia ubonensis TaxID=101571 RepID=UPI0009B40EB6|nr:EAL domain-containing protein [Burkholderia ubonensis]